MLTKKIDTKAQRGSSGRVKSDTYDICIVGGGASGMAAAISALRKDGDLSVIIIEKNDILGKKLRATGSGRCNITNREAEGYLKALEFFRSIGLATREYDNGLVYPYSETAGDVADILSDRLTELGCRVLTAASVTSIEITETGDDERNKDDLPGFTVRFEKRGEKGRLVQGEIKAERVILSAGGKAGSSFGTTGDGYRFAKDLGHSVLRPVPVLTKVICAEAGGSVLSGIRVEADSSVLSGIRAKGRVMLFRDESKNFKPESKVFEESGEIQFTRTGLSGIAVFNMTRFMRLDQGIGFESFAIDVDLFPGESIWPFLVERRNQDLEAGSQERSITVLRSVLRRELAEYIIKRSAISPDKKIADLDDSELDEIARNVHALRFRPTGLNGWKDAQCTSGGVSLAEVDGSTCESKSVGGLFITGELLDYDGPCGGFNLTHAWLTGIAAGESAALSLG